MIFHREKYFSFQTIITLKILKLNYFVNNYKLIQIKKATPIIYQTDYYFSCNLVKLKYLTIVCITLICLKKEQKCLIYGKFHRNKSLIDLIFK